MELEFERKTIRGYETVGSVCLRQEETLESIVPDSCPDILQIVDVLGQANLLTKEAKERTAIVNGVVRAVILYQPDQGECLHRMEVGIPFSCQADMPGLTDHGIVLACPRLCSAEARMLNSRKVLLRVDLAVDVTACQVSEQNVSCTVSNPEEHAICQQQYNGEHYHLASVQEKTFTFTDSIRLQGSQSEMLQVLAVRAEASCTESKLIGNKLIFKGNVNVNVLVQETTGLLSNVHESMPFSQVIEASDVGEDGDCIIFVEVMQLDWTLSADDNRRLDLSLELMAQGQVYDCCSVMLLSDLYSTKRQTEVQREQLTVCRLEENSIRTQSVRELLDVQEGVRSIIDCRTVLGPVSQRREGDEVLLCSDAWVTALYLTETGELRCMRNCIPVSCRCRCASTFVCRCIRAAEQGVFAVPAAGGIEIHFNIDFLCQTISCMQIPVVHTAKLGDARNHKEGERPSIVLRLAEPGESLWDLAKAYATTIQDIQQANELDTEQPPMGQMLLIPGGR